MSDAEHPGDAVSAYENPLETSESIGDDLSPSVRRLVRQYQLDVTGIHGTGPSGRIRVGDVMALVGGREAVASDMPDRASGQVGDVTRAPALTSPGALATAVYECDVSRVLRHQKGALDRGKRIELISYFVAAAVKALIVVPELNGGAEHIDIAVSAQSRQTIIGRDLRELSLDALDRALAASSATDRGTEPTFVIKQHSGSVFAFPVQPTGTALAALGVGKIRRVVAVKTVNGEDTPRITAQCYLGLSYATELLEERHVNRFLTECVGQLETYGATAQAT